MKLFVDDIRETPDDSWHVARTINEAIRFIARNKNNLDEISLDHDSAVSEETFQAVAYYIAARYAEIDGIMYHTPKITIHSANPVGAKEIYNILIDARIKSTIALYSK